MGYMQMTLNDWLEMKQSLERELSNLKTGFIRVGYVLRRIEESKGYEQDGYKSVAEFAKAEYGLSASTVSRFMAINERFSLGGYSERLDPQYIGFHQSIMGEMLGLPDGDMELITPDTSRRDLRELKRFNRQEPEHGVADDLRELLENYFRENRQELNELYSGSGQPTKEVLNPSGNKVYRKGMYMLFFYPDCVKTKKFGGGTSSYTWEEFREMVDEVFAPSAGQDTYGNYFNEPVSEPAEDVPVIDEPAEDVQAEDEPAEDVRAEDTPVADEPAEDGPEEAEDAENPSDAGETEDHEEYHEEPKSAGEGMPEPPETPPEAEERRKAEQRKRQATKPESRKEDTPQEDDGAIAPAQFSQETGRETEPEVQEANAPSEPGELRQEYTRTLADAGDKLDEVEKSFKRRDWNGMSDLLISLGFIVNQLKALSGMMG